MPQNNNSNDLIGFPEFNPLSLSTYIPTYQLWCGPGWSAGQRVGGPLTEEQERVPVGQILINGQLRKSQVDTACKAHDILYSNAIGKPDEAYQILQADVELMRDVANFDWSLMSSTEKTYASLLATSFAFKIAVIDSPSAAFGILKNETSSLYSSIFSNPDFQSEIRPNNSFSDEYGNGMSGTFDENGNISLNFSKTLFDIDNIGSEKSLNATFLGQDISSMLDTEIKVSLKPEFSITETDSSGNQTTSPLSYYEGDSFTQLSNSGLIATDAYYTDDEGNVIDPNNAFITINDSDNGGVTLVRDDVNVELKDGTTSPLSSLIEMGQKADEALTDFIGDAITESVDQLTSGIFHNQQLMASVEGEFLGRILLGDSIEDIATELSIKLASDSLVNRAYEFLPNLSDDNTPQVTGTEFTANVIKAGLITFGTMIATKAAKGETLHGSDYGEAAAISLTTAAAGQYDFVNLAFKTPTPTTANGVPVPGQEGVSGASAANAGIAAAVISFGTSLANESSMNSEEYEAAAQQAMVAAVVATITTVIVASILTAISVGALTLPGIAIGAALGAVIGGVIGNVYGETIYNVVHDSWNANEEVYDGYEDLIKGQDLEENIKQILKGYEDYAKAITINLSQDIGRATMDLVSDYGKNLEPGEYWNPYSFLKIIAKEDGTGNTIYGVETDGVVAFAREYYNDDIYGTDGNDILVGKSGTNTLVGRGGNDLIEGRGDTDQIYGGDGDDIIEAGGDNDYVQGDAGNDLIYGDSGDDIILGGTGNDIIYGGTGNDRIEGNDGDDIIKGEAGDDTLVAGAGNDNVEGGSGADTIFGEAGNDEIDGGDGNDVIDGGSGADIILGGDGNDNIKGDDGDDEIYGGSGADILYGDAGSDIIHGEDGGDLIFGGLGNDVIYGGTGDDSLYGEIGNDYVLGGQGNDTLSGFDGDDILFGGLGNDSLDGGDGLDTYIFRAGDGSDTITDSDGSNDVIKFTDIESSQVTLTKDGDNLVLTFTDSGGNPTSDQITITDQLDNNDIVETLEFTDGKKIDLTAITVNGDNSITHTTEDYYNIDTTIQAELAQEYTEELDIDAQDQINTDSTWYDTNYESQANKNVDNEHYNEVQWRSYKKKRSKFGGHYTVWYKYYEANLQGTNGNDRIVGNWWMENIDGGEGDDQLYGNGGNDVIYGQNGNDYLNGGSDSDTLHGGNGSDKIEGGTGNDIIDGENGNDTLFGQWGNDNIYGGAGDDFIDGGQGNDIIKGDTDIEISATATRKNIHLATNGQYIINEGGNTASGNDIILGGDGDDVIDGEGGNDLIKGGSGDDTLSGNDGNDKILGNEGVDTITGDSGNDLIIGNDGSDTLSGGDDNDTIHGRDGNDIISGNDGDDYVSGGAGYDIIDGNDGADTLYGNGGVDVIHGNEGNDNIYGGSGNDQLFGDDGNDTIYGGSGTNTIQGGSGNDTITGGEHHDNVQGGSGNDTIFGRSGGDLLNGGDGDDTISGGAGNDILIDGSGDDSLIGGNGDDIFIIAKNDQEIDSDTIEDFEKNQDKLIIKVNYQNPITFATLQSLMTQNGNDVEINFDSGQKITIANTVLSDLTQDNVKIGLSGGEDNDILFGESSDDILFGEGGDDQVYGGDGDDELWGGSGADALYGQGGSDILRYEADGVFLSDTSASLVNYTPDSTYGYFAWQGNHIHLPTDDQRNYYSDSDIAYKHTDSTESSRRWVDTWTTKHSRGKWGHYHRYHAATRYDNKYAIKEYFTKNFYNLEDININGYNRSYDSFDGGSGSDILLMTEGDDMLALDDLTSSNPNPEQARVRDMSVIYANDGNDIINFSSPKYNHGDIIIYAGNGHDRVFSSIGNDTIFGQAGNDQIYAGSGADFISGGIGLDTIYGGNDNDNIEGGAGNDIILGEAGDDTIEGGSGSDTMYGGDGSDTISYATSTSGVTVNIANNTASGGDASGDIISGFENIIGSDFVDYLTGDDGNNIIEGGAGDDILTGGGGSDTYIYNIGDGNDTITDGINNHGDVITLDESISRSDLLFSKSEDGNDLIIRLKDNDRDSLTIKDQLVGDSRIEAISFANDNDQTIDLEHRTIVVDEDETIIINLDEIEQKRITAQNISILPALYGLASYDEDTGLLTYRPNENFYGIEELSYFTTDNIRETSNINTLNLLFSSVNDNPMGVIENQEVTVDEEFTINFNDYFSDVDGDELTYSVNAKNHIGLPGFLNFNHETNELSGAFGRNGKLEIEISANDGNGGTHSASFMISANIDLSQWAFDIPDMLITDGTDNNDILTATTNQQDMLSAQDGDDILNYVQDGIWQDSSLQRFYSWNVYSGDKISINGKFQSFDSFDGGIGNDTLNLTNGNDVIFLDDPVTSSLSNSARISGIEIINGGDGNDIIDLSSLNYEYGDVTLNGGDGDDVLWSNSGDDVLNGGAGNDNLQAGTGNDILNGDEGNDILKGYDGDEILTGGLGADTMTGGFGFDSFNFNSLDDSTINSSDLITDFTRGEDLINFSDLGFINIMTMDELNQQADNDNILGYEYDSELDITIIQDLNSDFAINLSGRIDLESSDFNFGI